jgi:hypothetical protein
MKTLILVLYLTNGEVAEVPIVLAVGEWCSDKIDEITTVNEEGSRILYKDQVVWAHYCMTIDGKYYIGYNDGKELE